MGHEHWLKSWAPTHNRCESGLADWGPKMLKRFLGELRHWRSRQGWGPVGADGEGREGGPAIHPHHGEKALWLLLVDTSTALGCWYPPCRGAVGLGSLQKVPSLILVHPQPGSYALPPLEGKRDHSLFCSSRGWCPRCTSAWWARKKADAAEARWAIYAPTYRES